MRTRLTALLLAAAAGAALMAQAARPADRTWTTSFVIDSGELVTTGRNPYFILEPGYVLTLEDRDTRLVITVLNETQRIDSVDTRVVEERETSKSQPVEVSRNFFAISKRTNAVFYFGEDVDMYKNGQVVSHEGAWRAGVNGARFGLALPGLPLVSAKYYQEIAPGVAMDRAEILGLNETVKTPAGEFKDVLKVTETTPLEPAVREFKYYANGVGLIQDGSLRLVKYGPAFALRASAGKRE
ncbi:MAG TPA: hypothetical protein VES67_23425 [Vicinamibacterales bacterium]|nr:hypothetical protein [Vicinamibacterales bacterium]